MPLPDGHTAAQVAEFADRLDRVARYLVSPKLRFAGGALELNPAPFKHAEAALPKGSPLTHATLFLRETCWSPEDLECRRIMVSALQAWCRAEGA